MKEIVIGDVKIMLARVKGQYHAILNKCTNERFWYIIDYFSQALILELLFPKVLRSLLILN